MASKYEHPEIRFWTAVKSSRDGCWEWRAAGGCRKITHYGWLVVDGKNTRAHRFSWQIHYGDIPDGLFVCHKCDNPCCVRPDHLFLGTCADNNADAIAKGRMLPPPAMYVDNRGERCGAAKLKQEDVILIRELREAGWELLPLAKRFGISRTQVHNIVARKKWAHL